MASNNEDVVWVTMNGRRFPIKKKDVAGAKAMAEHVNKYKRKVDFKVEGKKRNVAEDAKTSKLSVREKERGAKKGTDVKNAKSLLGKDNFSSLIKKGYSVDYFTNKNIADKKQASFIKSRGEYNSLNISKGKDGQYLVQKTSKYGRQPKNYKGDDLYKLLKKV